MSISYEWPGDIGAVSEELAINTDQYAIQLTMDRAWTVSRPCRTVYSGPECSCVLWRAMANSAELLRVFMGTLRLFDE